MADRIEPGRAYSSAQVAQIVFQHDVVWFYRYRAQTAASEGFPPPVSGRGHPRWAGARLLAWMQGDRAIAASTGEGATVVDIRGVLRNRSRGLARGQRRSLA